MAGAPCGSEGCSISGSVAIRSAAEVWTERNEGVDDAKQRTYRSVEMGRPQRSGGEWPHWSVGTASVCGSTRMLTAAALCAAIDNIGY